MADSAIAQQTITRLCGPLLHHAAPSSGGPVAENLDKASTKGEWVASSGSQTFPTWKPLPLLLLPHQALLQRPRIEFGVHVGLVVHSNTGVGDQTFACSILARSDRVVD
ncbi:hypothetical protein KIN20_032768 [Parelaphostrongylus tenuis]|uniref:Uncharacterized protein n=1 Tax=Parelaphostrongylus tenuis TaxID=148309 RepID=A0AAD5MSZ3_PARTN|nr:hypothetical protein KIN20_021586 [Parelaphostrongylus tenuis]KAJ1370935.1 hypothetical protein KIN20_032763 [Parelaphostrongylus tenuis]KAJ1370940.1 hypothetical protein KIN20_032768 [Parelaphostrongylus tenuis]